MNKLLLLILLAFSTSCFAQIPSISEVRWLYQKAATEEPYCQKLLHLLQPFNEKNNPLLAGYKASAHMMMANYVVNPFTKLSYFSKGKKLLEKAIEASKANVELRFLRFAVQSNIPAFLGYSSNRQTDKGFLIQSVPQLKDVLLKQMIVAYLNTPGLITENEKESLTDESGNKRPVI